jgi:hypothetical protein
MQKKFFLSLKLTSLLQFLAKRKGDLNKGEVQLQVYQIIQQSK